LAKLKNKTKKTHNYESHTPSPEPPIYKYLKRQLENSEKFQEVIKK
jgi:hypothetical protein